MCTDVAVVQRVMMKVDERVKWSVDRPVSVDSICLVCLFINVETFCFALI